MHFVGSIAELAGEGDYFSNDKLSNATRVGERRVEDGNTMASGEIQVDLVGTDAEATDDE